MKKANSYFFIEITHMGQDFQFLLSQFRQPVPTDFPRGKMTLFRWWAGDFLAWESSIGISFFNLLNLPLTPYLQWQLDLGVDDYRRKQKKNTRLGLTKYIFHPIFLLNALMYSGIKRRIFLWPLIDSTMRTKKGIAIQSGFYRKEGAIREG